MHDLLVTGAAVVDGRGSPARRADVAVTNGRVVEIGDLRGESARRRVDADGRVVAPGFVDIHTHYDAQVLWDETLAPSVLHGVTTAIGGNCGFSVFPLSATSADYVVRMLATVEGMPLAALEAAADWDWASYQDYASRFAGRTAINVGFLVGHSTLRRVVMGDDATTAAASPEQLEQMRRIVGESLEAGALGFSSSCSRTHHDGAGDPVPSRAADAAEVLALSAVVAEHPGTSLEFAPGPDEFPDEVVDLMTRMSLTAHRPVNWNLLLVDAANPDTFRQQLTASDAAAAAGARVVALTLPSALTLRITLAGGNALAGLPGLRDVMPPDRDARIRALRDPAVRDRLAAVSADELPDNYKRFVDWPGYVFAEPISPQHQRYTGRSVGDIAREESRRPIDVLLDVVCDDALDTGLQPSTPGLDDATWKARGELWRDARVAIGGSDAGAHLDMIDSFNASTALLAAARDHSLATTEEAVRLITDVPARLYGLRDRGRLEVGAVADLVVFDPDTVAPGVVRGRHDLPASAFRLFSEPVGLDCVVVGGEVVVDGGSVTGARPGKLLQSGVDTARVGIHD